MKKTDFILIKLGGSLITYKNDQTRINDYLEQIDLFMLGKGSLNEVRNRIIELTDNDRMNAIFQKLKLFLSQNPDKKIVLIHGAGSIGHSLVLHLMKDHSDLQTIFPIIKLAVSIQNQIVVASAIKNGLKAISFPSHPLLTGDFSDEISTKKANSPNLEVFEQILIETDAIPVFFGDVGLTPSGWKVFSGDIYPAALIRRQNRTQLSSIIFLTKVVGKKTGIYTKDPSLIDSEFISLIEANLKEPIFYDINRNVLKYVSGNSKTVFDVTEAMGGKLRNLIELASNNAKCWVVGIDEFEKALRGQYAGTTIVSNRESSVNVTFLGTGDAFGSSGLLSASVLIEMDKKGILFDCGPHTLSTLKKLNRSTNDIDIVIITHFHGDHSAGVPFILLDSTFQEDRTKPLTIIGPIGIENKINNLFFALYENLAVQELSFSCKYISISPNNSLDIDNLSIEAIKTVHTPESQGYRLKNENLVIAYSGDTGWTDNLIRLVKETDLAIVECNFFDLRFDNHLNYFDVVKLQSLTQRLALIHLGSDAIKRIPLVAKEPTIFIPLEGQEIRI